MRQSEHKNLTTDKKVIEMNYKNPHYRRIKNSLNMIVKCIQCKNPVIRYQKKGRGRLLHLYISRVIESQVDLAQPEKQLTCPFCQNVMARLGKGRPKKYHMMRGHYETRVRV